jgi:pyruvate carboxylase
MPKKIEVTELIPRDAHQSLLATRMAMEGVIPACEDIDKAGFWSVECWGGATFAASVRFLNEDPWKQLRTFRTLSTAGANGEERRPISGIVGKSSVPPGESLEPGDLPFVVEATKLETEVTAPVVGKVAEGKGNLDDSVKGGQVVLVWA